jgi:hypothetical protein
LHRISNVIEIKQQSNRFETLRDPWKNGRFVKCKQSARHFLCFFLHAFRFSLLEINHLKHTKSAKIERLDDVRPVWHKSNEQQFVRANKRNYLRSHVTGITIDNQHDLAVVFGSFTSVIHLWDENMLQRISKQYFGDESFYRNAHGVSVPFK